MFVAIALCSSPSRTWAVSSGGTCRRRWSTAALSVLVSRNRNPGAAGLFALEQLVKRHEVVGRVGVRIGRLRGGWFGEEGRGLACCPGYAVGEVPARRIGPRPILRCREHGRRDDDGT